MRGCAAGAAHRGSSPWPASSRTARRGRGSAAHRPSAGRGCTLRSLGRGRQGMREASGVDWRGPTPAPSSFCNAISSEFVRWQILVQESMRNGAHTRGQHCEKTDGNLTWKSTATRMRHEAPCGCSSCSWIFLSSLFLPGAVSVMRVSPVGGSAATSDAACRRLARLRGQLDLGRPCCSQAQAPHPCDGCNCKQGRARRGMLVDR